MDKKTLPHTESDQWQDQGKSGPVVIFGPRIIYGQTLYRMFHIFVVMIATSQIFPKIYNCFYYNH